ncbi:BnaC06g23480D [Brassica napus]|uniref:BnaC06g23480D protein n=1 Tax=Brassica napus TaxID=3708 RepID=A0A078FCP5_BRANA|nr:BnaC06g23480D [Brassica napus]
MIITLISFARPKDTPFRFSSPPSDLFRCRVCTLVIWIRELQSASSRMSFVSTESSRVFGLQEDHLVTLFLISKTQGTPALGKPLNPWKNTKHVVNKTLNPWETLKPLGNP